MKTYISDVENLIKDWDYSKNDLDPKKMTIGSSKSAHWKCSTCGHEWGVRIRNRGVYGSGCPSCNKKKGRRKTIRREIRKIGSLADLHPELMEEWDFSKNTSKPSEFLSGSGESVYWICKTCGHSWKAKIKNRVAGKGCPQCQKGYRISFPEKAIYFYLNKYLPCTVEENFKDTWLLGKELDVYIPSLKLGIEYDGSPWHRDLKRDMEKNRLCQENDVLLLRIREKGCVPLKETDNIIYTVNPKREMESQLTEAIQNIFEFISSHFHLLLEYNIDFPKDRTDIYELLKLHKQENSIQNLYPEIAKYWHPTKNGTITPKDVNSYCEKNYWWICEQGHVYDMSPKNKAIKGSRCPVCSNKRVIKGYNDLESEHPDIAKYWDYEFNGKLLPSEVSSGSKKKAYWTCTRNHHYPRRIHSQTKFNYGCPECKKMMLQ